MGRFSSSPVSIIITLEPVFITIQSDFPVLRMSTEHRGSTFSVSSLLSSVLAGGFFVHETKREQSNKIAKISAENLSLFKKSPPNVDFDKFFNINYITQPEKYQQKLQNGY